MNWGPFRNVSWPALVNAGDTVSLLMDDQRVRSGKATETPFSAETRFLYILEKGGLNWAIDPEAVIGIIVEERFEIDPEEACRLFADFVRLRTRLENQTAVTPDRITRAVIEYDPMRDAYAVYLRHDTADRRFLLTMCGWHECQPGSATPHMIYVPVEVFRFAENERKIQGLERDASEAKRARDDALKIVAVHEKKDDLVRLALTQSAVE